MSALLSMPGDVINMGVQRASQMHWKLGYCSSVVTSIIMQLAATRQHWSLLCQPAGVLFMVVPIGTVNTGPFALDRSTSPAELHPVVSGVFQCRPARILTS